MPEYMERLGRSLDMPIEVAGPDLAPLPRARDLHIDLMPGAIDLLDLFALRDCRLNVTIGKSNSSLGKLATSSQRLLLELEFLTLAPACIRSLRDRGESRLAAMLEAASAEKRGQLPARIWNATLAGPEFREFWQRPATLANYPDATGGAVPAALSELAALIDTWLSGEHGAGHERLEALLGAVRRGDGGSLLASLATQRRSLASATPAVRQRIAGPALCFGGTPSPEARIFETVVRKYFIGEVQPWAVALARRRQLLREPLAAMEEALEDVTPAAYRAWRVQRDRLLNSSIESPRRHAMAIAELLETCVLRPGSDTS